jgi:hypothetical protein
MQIYNLLHRERQVNALEELNKKGEVIQQWHSVDPGMGDTGDSRDSWKICAPWKYTDVPVQLTKRPENQEHG